MPEIQPLHAFYWTMGPIVGLLVLSLVGYVAMEIRRSWEERK